MHLDAFCCCCCFLRSVYIQHFNSNDLPVFSKGSAWRVFWSQECHVQIIWFHRLFFDFFSPVDITWMVLVIRGMTVSSLMILETARVTWLVHSTWRDIVPMETSAGEFYDSVDYKHFTLFLWLKHASFSWQCKTLSNICLQRSVIINCNIWFNGGMALPS